ncbi:MAG: hypothetical protein AAB438_01625 [Patescibacteria group bacterium]
MIDPTKIDINQLPKKLCDGAIGNFNKSLFFFVLTSGNSVDSYATSPQIMKSLMIFMNEQIKKYEQSYGEIDMTPPQIISPLQISDLGSSKK